MDRPDTNIYEHKCPNCGGAVEFDSTLQKLKCPYCDTEFDIENVRNHDAQLANELPDQMSWSGSQGNEWREGETKGMRVYICNSCAGEIIGDANTGASSCPYCGNHAIMMTNFTGALRPDYVIPFKLDKTAAKANLLKFYQGKTLLPKIFKDANHIDEIKGIYVPFWLFNADVYADMKFKGTKTKSWYSNGEDWTSTEYFALMRTGTVSFDCVPVDGSKKMADDLMESLEPYNFNEAVDFNTAYLSGFFADKYDVTADESIDRANDRIKKSTEDAFRATTKDFGGVVVESSHVQFDNGTYHYALYPVWLLNTNYNGKRYTFAMNGQSGKFVGDDLPVDRGKYFAYLFGLAMAWGLGIFAVLSLLVKFVL